MDAGEVQRLKAELLDLESKLRAAGFVYDALSDTLAGLAENVNDALRQSNNLSVRVVEWANRAAELAATIED